MEALGSRLDSSGLGLIERPYRTRSKHFCSAANFTFAKMLAA